MRRRLVAVEEPELGAEQPDALGARGGGRRGVGGVADVRQQLDVVAVGGVPVAVERAHLRGERQRGQDLLLGGVDRHRPRGAVDEHEALGQHGRLGAAGRDDRRDAAGAREDRGVRRGAARPGDDREHALGVERRDDRGCQVGRDEHERRLVRGHAGRRAAGELGDEPVADVGDVPRALREVAAERLELRGRPPRRPPRRRARAPAGRRRRAARRPRRASGRRRSPRSRAGGRRSRPAARSAAASSAARTTSEAAPIRFATAGVVGAGRQPSARGRLGDRVGHEHRGRDDAAGAHPDAGDDRGGCCVHRTHLGVTSSST